MKKKLLILLILSFTAVNFTVFAQEETNSKLSIQLVPHNEGMFPDRLLQIHAQIENEISENIDLKIHWVITDDEGTPLKSLQFPYKVKGDSLLSAYCPIYRFKKDGFFRVTATFTYLGEKHELYTVVGTHPENISSPLRKPKDFDKFWEDNLKELAAVAPHYKLKKVKRDKSTKTNLFEVEMQSTDGITVRGWLEVPKKKGVYPTILEVPGYTVSLEPQDKYDDMIVFSFNVRDHGNSDNTGPRHYKMWNRGLEDQNKFYYKGIYLDCIRAMDFLMTRNDVDKSRIAIAGASQGGGLAMITTALDSRISFCVAGIPFLTDWERYFTISHWEEIDEFLAAHPSKNWNDVLDVLSYFDSKNLMHKIKVPVSMSIGLQDDVCPPATSFSAYNRITSTKNYFIDQTQGHWITDEKWDSQFEEIRAYFKMNKVK
ncbi:hypothetical protein EI427_03990 [Flammeovirga pectinis]|uniref:Acetyl xylan esterase domain-containing protein n=1 Tax=Flammeovirga pectinis TaxID=2494373 RepID=A0A3S9NZQ0_9BACT|nr:acetylxylan esterase [Flammeovirga pectinis]AZQ61413.1 hypothetical protein EI427_03990 [Flammeovirga pectinis]